MTPSSLTLHLKQSFVGLARFAPYSTNPDFKAWRAHLESLKDVHAALELVDQYKPGHLNDLVNQAYEDAVLKEQPMREISDLIARYSKKREPL